MSDGSSTNATSSPPAIGWMGPQYGRIVLGYGVAIAVGMMVFVCTMMMVCVRLHAGRSAAAAQRERRRSQGGAEMVEYEVGGGRARVFYEARQGIDEATLQSCPKIIFGGGFGEIGGGSGVGTGAKIDTSCAICLADYSRGDALRLLPDCGHSFHVTCIDAWLRLHVTCPVCRSSPVSSLTPLPLRPLG